MGTRQRHTGLLWIAILLTAAWAGGEAYSGVIPPAPFPQGGKRFSLETPDAVEAYFSAATATTYKARKALRLVETPGQGSAVALVRGSEMLDGTIEVELAGRPLPNAPEGSRGFVGIAFRTQPEGRQFEAFYLRPTNGRADDQLRRNHSTQYISYPGYPWHKLRSESPGVYESYVDLVEGEWTRVRIEFKGASARLFVHDAAQPCLIVKDLKQSPASGAVALWIGQGTEAFFRNLRITPGAGAN